MKLTSAWFSMAVHALALLATSKEGYPSSYIAGSVNTNPVFLRRVLARLVQTGMIETREGREGGYKLARSADAITLADVYRSMELGEVIAPSPAEPNQACPVGAGIRIALQEVTGELDRAIYQVLEKITVAELSERAIAEGTKKNP